MPQTAATSLCRRIAARWPPPRRLLSRRAGAEAQSEGGHGGHDTFYLFRRDALAIIVMNGLRRALVVSNGKNAAWVCLDGETAPRLAQLRRQTGKRFMPVPGDVVFVRVLEDEKTVVDRIEPRSFHLERRSAGGRAKTIAANVDTMVTVTALADPAPRLIVLDQLLAFVELESIEAIVVFTKPDLSDPAGNARVARSLCGLGVSALVLNPKAGENVDALRQALDGRHALLSGNSGVGQKLDLPRARGRSGRRRCLTSRDGSPNDDGRSALPYARRLPYR